MENKSAKMTKFEELAERRVNEAIKKIQLIGNLSNAANYEYSEKHVRQILSAIRGEVKNLEARFSSKGKSEKEGFKFKV